MTTATTCENVTPEPDAPSSPPGASRRILIVDDDLDIHTMYRKILLASQAPGAGPEAKGEYSWELDFAAQGREGLKLVQKAVAAGRPYMVAFIDGSMPPGWDGLETTARIWEADPNVQVILCTGDAGYRFEEVVAKVGRSDRFVILKKPFAALEVQQLASAFTEKWNLLRDLQDSMHRVRESEQCHRFVADEMETQVLERTAELGATRRRLEHLLRSSPAVIYSLKITQPPRFTFVSDNFSALAGYEAKELVNDPAFWRSHVHPDDAPKLAARLEKLLESGALPVNYRFLHKDGSYRWMHDEALITRDHLGAAMEIIGSLTDITKQKEAELERQRMEVQLRQAQKMEAIGQMAAGIAHEINTPTQYVGDNTRFLQDSFKELEPVLKSHEELMAAAKSNAVTPELLARAEQTLSACDLEYLSAQIPAAITETLEGISRVTKIVRAMKEFSHPGGKEKTSADLNKAIESTTTVARNEWKYVADLKLDLAPDLPLVPCYLGEFNQMILNLIVNAAHAIGDVIKGHGDAKGLITVATRREGECAEIRVSDTGTGIPEQVRPHIFEPFFTTKSVGKGSGQGLSIVYGSIVKKHGGTVTFETETGRGTTFILRLPIASSP